MNQTAAISLHLTTDSIELFCRDVINGSASSARAHATLIALESLISNFSGSDSHNPAQQQILQIVRNFSEQTRSKLLAEHSQALRPALREGHIREITAIFNSLSRGGFWELLSNIDEQLTTAERSAALRWIDPWCKQAEAAAGEASGYPGAMDFRAANLDLREYSAIKECQKRLSRT